MVSEGQLVSDHAAVLLLFIALCLPPAIWVVWGLFASSRAPARSPAKIPQRATYDCAFIITDEGNVATRDGRHVLLSYEHAEIAYNRATRLGQVPAFIKAEGKWLEALNKLQAQSRNALGGFISKSGQEPK